MEDPVKAWLVTAIIFIGGCGIVWFIKLWTKTTLREILISWDRPNASADTSVRLRGREAQNVRELAALAAGHARVEAGTDLAVSKHRITARNDFDANIKHPKVGRRWETSRPRSRPREIPRSIAHKATVH